MKGDFSFEPLQNARRLGDGLATRMKVSFRKGPRSFEDEEVEILSKDEIRAALLVILESNDAGAQEQMKPINMAHCSPRVFWNLVRNHNNTNAGVQSDVNSILHALFPSADLSFLYSRPKKLSTKARENKRQSEAHAARKVAAEARRRERLALRKARMDQSGTNGIQEASVSSAEETGCKLETVADITGPAVANLLLGLGIKTIDKLADQEAGNLTMKSQDLPRVQIDNFIEDARQNVILRCLGAIVREASSRTDEMQHNSVDQKNDAQSDQLPDLDSETIPMVCVLQDAGIVAPRDLTLHRTPDIFKRVEEVIKSAKDNNQEVPAQEVTESLVAKWRLLSWTHLGARPWMADYFAGDDGT